jgi:hypothetical protein
VSPKAQVPPVAQVSGAGPATGDDAAGVSATTFATGVVGQALAPAVYATEVLAELNPFLFLDFAVTFSALPFLIDLIVQEVLVFAMVQDFPPAVTLLPVIFEPPSEAGSVIVMVTFTLPFFGVEEDRAETVGAEGFVTFAFA